MKKQLVKSAACKLVFACIVGCSCRSSLVSAQQLAPATPTTAAPAQLPPIVKSSEFRGTPGAIPRIVKASDASGVSGGMPAIVKAAGMTENSQQVRSFVKAAESSGDARLLPPIIPAANAMLPEPTAVAIVPASANESRDTAEAVNAAGPKKIIENADLAGSASSADKSVPIAALPAVTAPITPPLPVIQGPETSPPIPDPAVLGKNFPSNASEKIAEFIRSNRIAEIENTAFMDPALSANDIAMPIVADSAAWKQQASPGDFRQPTPPEYFSVPAMASPDFSQPGANRNAWTPDQSAPSTYTQPQPQGYADPQSGLWSQDSADTWAGESPNYESGAEYADGTYSPAELDYGNCEDTFACCGFVSNATRYFVLDGLYWNRSEGAFRASNITTIDNFDWTPGGRITAGHRRDSTRGWEASYMQVDPWLAVSSQYNAGGQLIGAIFPSPGGLPNTAFSAFRNATFLQQFQKSNLLGAEINKTYWGSDVAKGFIGARFIYFGDEFRLSSANVFGQQGIYNINTTNSMFGAHCGGEVLYDIGYRLAFSFSGKLGGYANFYEGRKGLLNNNTIYVNTTLNDTRFSGSIDLGAYARWKLGPRARLRFGYEALALINVLDVQSNFSTVVLPTDGQRYNDGNAVFHGAVLGIEIFR